MISVHHKPAPCGTELPVPGAVSAGWRCSRCGPSVGPLSLPTRGSARLRGTGSALVPAIKSLSTSVKLEPTSSWNPRRLFAVGSAPEPRSCIPPPFYFLEEIWD